MVLFEKVQMDEERKIKEHISRILSTGLTFEAE
jgi:hypothetical protein